MERRKITKIATFLLVMTLVFSGILVTSGTTLAQAPSVTLSSADLVIDVTDSEQTFTGEYTFTVNSVGDGLSEISGTLWEFDQIELRDISAEFEGSEATPSIEDFDQHKVVAIPVEGVSDGDEITITVSYSSDPWSSDQAKMPIWVPEFQTRERLRNIDLSVNLPEGEYPQGDTFPNVNKFEDGTAVFYLIHVPSFMTMLHGPEKAGIATLNNLMSALGLIAIFGFFIVWFFANRYFKKQAEKRKIEEGGGM